MNSNIVISIFSITSSKGFSICKSLLNQTSTNKQITIKGYTNDIHCKKSKYLIEKGVCVVELVESSNKTITFENINIYNIVILVTDEFTIENEVESALKVVDLCINSKVSQLIFSTLPCTNSITNGKLTVDSFDNKYKIEQYIRSKSNQIKFTSYIYIPFFYQNFINLFPPFKININNFKYNYHSLNYTDYISNESNTIRYNNNKLTSNSTSFSFIGFDNNYYYNTQHSNLNKEFYSIPLPIEYNKSIYLCDRDEVGIFIKNELIDKPFNYNTQSILFKGSYMNGIEISTSLTKSLGNNIQYFYIPPELLNHFIKSVCQPTFEIISIFNFINEYNTQLKEYFENTDILQIYNFKPSTFNDYLNSNKNKIKIKPINMD